MMQRNEMMYSSRRTFWYTICPKRSYGCKVTAGQRSHKKLGFEGKKSTERIFPDLDPAQISRIAGVEDDGGRSWRGCRTWRGTPVGEGGGGEGRRPGRRRRGPAAEGRGGAVAGAATWRSSPAEATVVERKGGGARAARGRRQARPGSAARGPALGLRARRRLAGGGATWRDVVGCGGGADTSGPNRTLSGGGGEVFFRVSWGRRSENEGVNL